MGEHTYDTQEKRERLSRRYAREIAFAHVEHGKAQYAYWMHMADFKSEDGFDTSEWELRLAEIEERIRNCENEIHRATEDYQAHI